MIIDSIHKVSRQTAYNAPFFAKPAMLLVVTTLLCSLLPGCASTNGNEAEDPVDRLFSPLDNAVDDINHDLNEDEGGDKGSGSD